MKLLKTIFFRLLFIGLLSTPLVSFAQYNIGAVFSATGTIIDDEQALPLGWLSFSANLVDGKSELTWIVTNEQAIDSYQIEWSVDLSEWTTIGEVVANNSGDTDKYQYYQDNPVKGKNFYRIRSEENDGRKNYSDVVVLTVTADQKGEAQLGIYPNPTSGLVNIVLPTVFEVEKVSLVQIYDVNGKLVIEQEYQMGTPLLLHHLPAGAYQIFASQNNLRVRAGFLKTSL